MFRTSTTSKDILWSLSLAVAAYSLSLSWSTQAIESGWAPAVWNILLYLIPLAFGMRATLAAICFVIIPSALLDWATFDSLRIAAELLAIVAVRRAFPTVPGYMTVLGVWGLLILPVSYAFNITPSHSSAWSEELFFFLCVQDVSFSLVAGALLLNQSITILLTNRPRHNRVSEILVHVTTLCALLTLFTTIASLNRLGVFTPANLTHTNTTSAFLLFATIVILPSLVGYRLSLLASRAFVGVNGLSVASDQELRDTTELKESFFKAITNDGDFTSTLNIKSAEPDQRHEGLLKGVCALDGDGTVLFMNDHFRALTELELPGVEGYSLESIAPDSELIHHITNLFRSADPEREIVEERRLIERNGRIRFLEISVRPHIVENEEGLPDEEKRTSPRVITLRDITERRTLKHELMKEERLESLQAVSRGASEGLSELLRAINDRVQQLSLVAESGSADLYKAILVDLSRSQQIAQQLGELSSSLYSASRSKVDLATMITERGQLLQRLPLRATPLSLDVSSSRLLVEINTALVTHAVCELIMNASEAYGVNTGSISLQVAEEEIDEALSNIHPGTRPGRFARLRIMDQGQGMSPEVIAHAADPHFSTKEGAGHKGLGLATVFAIMREHEGFMTLESKLGKGSCVSLYFPLLAADTRADELDSDSQDSAETPTSDSNASEDNKV